VSGRGRRRARALLIATVAAVSTGSVSHDIQLLPQRREVRPATAGARWVVVNEDSALAAGAALDLADVRFMNDAGEALPAASIPPRLSDERSRFIAVVPVTWKETPGPNWVGLADLGASPDGAVAVTFDERTGAALRMDTGPDTLAWRPLPQVGADRWDRPPPREPYAPGRMEPSPATVRQRYGRADRHLRLTVGAYGGALPESLRVERWSVNAVPRDAVAFRVVGEGYRGRTWEATVEIAGPERALAALIVERRGPRVPLDVTLDLRVRRGGWSRAILTRALGISSRLDTLLIEPGRTTALRVQVANADPPNPPFTILGVEAAPQRWCVAPGDSGRLWIAYGDPYLEPKTWLSEDPTREDPGPVAATLGPEEPNPFHTPVGFGLEWLQRKPAVLTVAMVIVLAAVAIVIWRGTRSRAKPLDGATPTEGSS
jgi:hypothetical protein